MHEGVEEQFGLAGGVHALNGHPYLRKGGSFVDTICYVFIEIYSYRTKVLLDNNGHFEPGKE